ncbi:amino acid ABC transporter permease [Sediminispirochaeta bajacaliforniensis]|uniref:amino acid ABC transporter permease n=1 Tax=Sediminispirochaeta bajacaliforniensis TaxID=148 RepID=UPI0003767884|nr:amino acid ABC transporter permease [Sediminispirochaeta bajacaliforniensis]
MESIRRTLFQTLWEGGPDGLHLLLNGLKVTIVVTLFAIMTGVILGTLLALMRLSKNKVANIISKLYVEIIRGTPVLVQLLIIYFVIFRALDVDKTMASSLAFGINSGAYVAEIIRAGIQAVDKGQMEAARSLGLPHRLAMKEIILPQAIKNILPALGNEFIVLLKETSIIGFIGGNDLMRAGNKIRSITYEATVPLFATAIIYLIITLSLSHLLNRYERRLHSSD